MIGDRKPITHGTNAGYCHYGCRCGQCTAAHTNYDMRWRRRRNGQPLRPAEEEPATTDWVIVDFPVALVARKAFPNDTEAINAAYGDNADDS